MLVVIVKPLVLYHRKGGGGHKPHGKCFLGLLKVSSNKKKGFFTRIVELKLCVVVVVVGTWSSWSLLLDFCGVLGNIVCHNVIHCEPFWTKKRFVVHPLTTNQGSTLVNLTCRVQSLDPMEDGKHSYHTRPQQPTQFPQKERKKERLWCYVHNTFLKLLCSGGSDFFHVRYDPKP